MVVWLFLAARILFTVLYYMGHMIGKLTLRAYGVFLHHMLVGFMLLRVFLKVDPMPFLRNPALLLK